MVLGPSRTTGVQVLSPSAHPLLHLGNRPLCPSHDPTTAAPTQDGALPEPHISSWTGAGAFPLSRRLSSSTGSSSSFTAVEPTSPLASVLALPNLSPGTDAARTDPQPPPWTVPTALGDYARHQQQQQQDCSPSTPAPAPGRAEEDSPRLSMQVLDTRSPSDNLQLLPDPRPQQRRTNDDLGLQICAEMLSDRLHKTTFLGESDSLKGKKRESNKLQVLLLIKAYEATLESCRREVAEPPLTRGGEAEGVRRHHVREASRILDHWLEVLYAIYDEDFGDGDMF